MLIAALTILIGLIILVWSADLFVGGAASIAENMGMSPIIIGLTIVSIGTSAPEILVSMTAALSGVGELAIGNAIGSNIANIGLVLGIAIIVAPICVLPSCIRKELPILLLITTGVFLLLIDGELTRTDGILLLVVLTLTIVQMVRTQTKEQELPEDLGSEALPHLNPVRAWLTFALGLALLVGSSRMLVWGATIIAEQLGVSQLVIGLTVVAIGTSLPELAATVASAMRGHAEIAMGNVIGSNLFNLLAVMAIPGLVTTEAMEGPVLYRDYLTMAGLTALLAAAVYMSRRRKTPAPSGHGYLGRLFGVLLVTIYALYYYWLYITI